MKHLESFEAAAEFLGKDPKVLQILETLPEEEGRPLIASYKLSVLSDAAWKIHGEDLDWDDSSQEKYSGWFFMSSGSARGFSYLGYYYGSLGLGRRLPPRLSHIGYYQVCV